MDQSKVTCPNCNEQFDVKDIISQQLENKYKQNYLDKLNQEKILLKNKEEELTKKNTEFEALKKKENELFALRLEQKSKEQRKELEIKVKNKIEEENKEFVKDLQAELNDKSERLKELHKSKAEIERLKREKSELKEKAEYEAQKKLNERLREEKEKIQKIATEKHELQLRELQKQLQDQKSLTEEMKRKQDQGSMQLQGEVLELAIEENLKSKFPFDLVEEVPKGIRGADCIQKVRNSLMEDCGKIIFETKRTKAFSPEWITKLKDDMRTAGADVAVLITQTLPKDQQRFDLVNGVWVCTYNEYVNLTTVLREGIIKTNAVQASNLNKGDKMNMLYNFLTGLEFRQQVEAIIEGFTVLKEDLEKEKRAMHLIWKKREKQIEKVILNTTEMYGSVKGIAGSSIRPIKSLELDAGFDEIEEN